MAGFDPATIQLQRELLDRTKNDLARDRRLLTKQPMNSKSKMAATLRDRIAAGWRVVGDLERLIASMESAAAGAVLDERARWIADARALIDFIETNPSLPLNLFRGVEVTYHHIPDSGDDADRIAAVDAVAEQFGTPVTTPDMPGSHYETEIRFGAAAYRAIAVLREYREESDAIQRLGRAALAEQDAQAESEATQ